MASHNETASMTLTPIEIDTAIPTQEQANVSVPHTVGSVSQTIVAADVENVSKKRKKVKTTKQENYNTVLSAFDDFTKNESDNVGHGYVIGDMVWGKVKSHPWWPGHVYDESCATVSVRRSKREGHVLVAFYGDGSYGWFRTAELIPFEENFDEKSKQTTSKAFVYAVGEAVDELSRRRSMGVVCRCRNEFNFWPSGVEGHVIVDVGDYEAGSYSLRQVKGARDSFQPREMVSFVRQLALRPMDDQCKTIRFMKNKATVLACRKALFEEFDETYAQAFGTTPVRPPRPTAPPVTVDPSKAPLSGRLVIAETLGKGKASAKPTKSKEQLEKDKYLFKRRDGSGLSGRVGHSSQAHRTSEAGVTNFEQQSSSHRPPIFAEGGKKKAKTKRPAGELSSEKAGLVEKKKKRPAGELSSEKAGLVEKKRPAGELISDNAGLVEKKKRKKVKREISADLVQAPVLGSSSAKVESFLGNSARVPVVDDTTPVYDVEKSLSSPVETQQEVKTGKFNLADVVRDLRRLALDPSYAMHRGCAATARRVFWKYRSLVYKKSLILLPPAETDASEAGKLPATSTTVDRTAEKTVVKPVRPLGRADDPTRGGRKRGPLDNIEGLKKKKKVNNEEVKIKKKQARLGSGEIAKKNLKEPEYTRLRKKSIDSEDSKKRKVDDSKISAGDKRDLQPAPLKASKSESEKRFPSPTMLVMKFPADSSLPSGAALRAKFTRFGPLDHSATRVFWKTYQCRLVYHYKADAEEALKLCNESSVLFGNSNVKCHIRELAAEAVDAEPSKGPKEKASSQPALRTSGQSQQPHVQLKSCLKKPVGEDSGNGNGRGPSRVKFALGGEESSSRTESSAEGGSVSYAKMDAVSKNLPSSGLQPNFATTPPPVQFAHFAGNIPFDHRQRVFNPPPFPQRPVAPQIPNDISQQMMNLLMRCSLVVDNVKGALGYMPYHPL